MDIDYNELYGLDGADGADGTAPADVSDEGTDTDAGNAPEAGGDPDSADSGLSGDAVTEDDGTTEDDAGEGSEEEPQEDGAKGAEPPGADRERELAGERISARRSGRRREMDELVRSLGLKDAEGNAIESREALDAYRESRRSDEARAKLRRAGIDVEALETLVSENPEVRAARSIAAEAERERAQAAEIRQKAAFDEEIRKVGEIDPTVKNVEDLRAKPYFDEVYGMVERGYSISDAVRLATYDDHVRRVAEGSAKSAAAKAASKAHLVPTASRGQGASTVPAEVREQYRVFLPDASDADIQRMFNEDQKRMKK